MEVTRKQEPSLFNEISEFIKEHTVDEHRRSSNFFRRSIIEFTESHKHYFSDVVNFEQYVGFWETNDYIYDSEYGTDWSEITTLTKVEKVEKVIVSHEWKAVAGVKVGLIQQ